MSTEVLQDIENRIKQLEKRMESGRLVISQCKRQMSVLKKKLKEYKRLKEVVSYNTSSAADGDL